MSEPTFPVLNLGCGETYLAGSMNVDPGDRTVCDLLARGEALPFAEGSFAEVWATHVPAPLDAHGMLATLSEAYRVLTPAGRLVLEAPGGEPALLCELLAQAGFVEPVSEPPRTHLEPPALRLVARRGDDPRHLLLARLRPRLRGAGPFACLEIDALPELERRFFQPLFLALAPAETPPQEDVASPADPLALALAGLLVDAGAARLAWTEACALGLHPPGQLSPSRLIELATRAEQAGFPGVSWGALRRLAVATSLVDDPLATVTEAGLAVLREALADPELALAAALERRISEQLCGHAWAAALARESFLPRGGAFLPGRARRGARRLLARAIRQLQRGDEPDARRGLLLAANLRQQPLHALWNLAVLSARNDKLERAVTFYRAARLHAPTPELIAQLEQEEGACLAELGRGDEADWLVRRAAARAQLERGRADLVLPSSARRRPAGEEDGQDGGGSRSITLPDEPAAEEQAPMTISVPPRRTSPVVLGESWQTLP